MPNYDFKKQPVLLIQGAMEQHKVIANPTVEEILEAEAQAHAYISGKLS